MNKDKIILAVVVAVLVGGAIFASTFLTKQNTIVVDNNGRPVGAVSSALDVGPELGINGLQRIVRTGTFPNSTTTIVSLLNPFPATATVSFIGLFNTGVATSSYKIDCGSYNYVSAARTSSTPVSPVTMTADVATSTIFSQALKTPTSTITIGTSKYLLCVAHGVSNEDSLGGDNSWDSAFTNNGNTFDGKFWVEFMGLIQ